MRPLSERTERLRPAARARRRLRFVSSGAAEASHGTHEFYRERAEITKRLIREKGFTAVAVEADWPDAYRVNRYVRGASDDADADEALGGFHRFPTWMWRNADVLDFVGWLRAHNDAPAGDGPKVGFYGLDLYSLHASIEAVRRATSTRSTPRRPRRARDRYACFDHFGEDPQAYGYAAALRPGAESCEDEVVEPARRAAAPRGRVRAQRDGRIAEDEFFYAEQNARLVTNAEEYYRAMFRGRVSSWNLRDRHMAETLEALVEHLDRRGDGRRRSSSGRTTRTSATRARPRWASGASSTSASSCASATARDAVLVGFTTYDGHRDRGLGLGRAGRAQARAPGARRAATRRCSTTSGVPRFLLDLRDDGRRGRACASRGWSARSA